MVRKLEALVVGSGTNNLDTKKENGFGRHYTRILSNDIHYVDRIGVANSNLSKAESNVKVLESRHEKVSFVPLEINSISSLLDAVDRYRPEDVYIVARDAELGDSIHIIYAKHILTEFPKTRVMIENL